MSFEINDFTLFKDFPHPVFIITPDGRILDANQFFVNRFFSSTEEIRGKNVFALISEVTRNPELSARRKAKVDTVVATGRHLIFDDEESDGTISRSSVYPVKSPEGAVTHLLVIVHDVTEEVAAEKQARHTDHVFKALLDTVPGSVFILDDECLLISCNHYAFDLFGNWKGEIKNNNFFNLVFSEDQPRMKKILTDLIESGYDESAEVRMYTHEDRNNNNWFTIHARKTFIENRIYLVLVCIDISELKHSESHLFEYKKWLIKAMEAGNTGVWDWNIVTNAALWSNRLWDIYGIIRMPGQYPSFELWETAVHPDDREMVVESLRRAVAILADLNIEYRVVHPDNSVHWIFVSGKPLYNKHGEVKRYCGTAIDITDHKKFENEIFQIREHLDFILEKFHIGWYHMNLKNHSAIRTIEHARIFGYDSIDLDWSFDKFLEHVVDEDRERVKNLVYNSIANKTDFMVDSRIKKTNGDIRRILSSVSIIYDDRRNPTHLVGIVQDITDRLIPVS
jgi:PAS domain S-box-containing protein